MKVKTILISQFPLPYHKIGSWTTMYNYYLTKYQHSIDYIIGTKPKEKLNTVNYINIDLSFVEKVQKKVTKNKYAKLFKEIEKLVKNDTKYIIQLVDNNGLVLPLHNFLTEKKLRKNCYLQFFYHGFTPFFDSFKGSFFFKALDEHIMLTYKSYEFYKTYYAIMPCVFSVLHNGINSNQFFIVPKKKKEKIIFTWCSQDRPKKGLDFILKVWKLLIQQHKNIELQIIGTERKINAPQTKVIGKIPNDELPKYYQQSDFYLFPTLWQEGFGLSLAEALKCGCYCIASNYGGVPEVLADGKYGKLIENPHFIEEWVEEINKSIQEYIANNYQNPYLKNLPEKIYDLGEWCVKMDALINRAKILLHND